MFTYSKRLISTNINNSKVFVHKNSGSRNSVKYRRNFYRNDLISKNRYIFNLFKSINNHYTYINFKDCIKSYNRRRSISQNIPKLKRPYGINFLGYMRCIKYRSLITDSAPSISPIPGKDPTGELVEHFVLSNANRDNYLLNLLTILLDVKKILKINFNIHFPKAPLCDGCIWIDSGKSKTDIYALEIKNTTKMEETRCKVPINHSAKEVFDKYMKLVVISVETIGNQKDQNLELTGNIMISVPYFDDFNECPLYEETFEDKSRELIWLNGYKYSSPTFKHKFKF